MQLTSLLIRESHEITINGITRVYRCKLISRNERAIPFIYHFTFNGYFDICACWKHIVEFPIIVSQWKNIIEVAADEMLDSTKQRGTTVTVQQTYGVVRRSLQINLELWKDKFYARQLFTRTLRIQRQASRVPFCSILLHLITTGNFVTNFPRFLSTKYVTSRICVG